jgi:uncharacterized protein (DUF1015 family)
MGRVLAPPYDVIDREELATLRARDEHNIVWVDCPVTGSDVAGATDGVYEEAASRLQFWQQQGIVKTDASPSFYACEHWFSSPNGGGPVVRRGIFVHAGVDAMEKGEMLRHERTLAGPKRDRLRLLQATHSQTSPIFALWDGASGIESVLEAVVESKPLLRAEMAAGGAADRHGLWRVCDPSAVETLIRLFSSSDLYIADGHHRWETVTGYLRDLAIGDDAGVLVYLSSANDPGLIMLPTHRMVIEQRPQLKDSATLSAALEVGWTVGDVESLDAGQQKSAELRDTHHAVVAVLPGSISVLSRPKRVGASPREALDVVVLEEEVLAPAGIDKSVIEHGALRYSRDAESVADAVANGKVAAGFVLNPSSPQDMMAVAAAGDIMPQKSTYFYPKVPTGLVMSPLSNGPSKS